MKDGGRDRRASVLEEYTRFAPTYDERWAFYLEATTRETVARLELPPTGRLLDVGCGTGVLLERMAETHPRAGFAGVDPVPEMLSVARRRLPPSIELREAWAERLPFADGRFDVVVSCNMFHYVEEPALALREMIRVLRPGGRVVVTDWCDDYLACRICSLYLRWSGRPHSKVYGVRECAGMLAEAGLAVEEADSYKINWLWGLMTVRAAQRES